MKRKSSLSNIKNSNKKDQDHRTTKTKASASKPQIFTMSLARNKYNPTPSLFNSVKKQNNQQKCIKNNKENRQSQTKKLSKHQKQINIFESLHTKVSFDYINSLYSDIGVQFGFRLKDQLQNKQNILKQKNLNVSMKLPGKEEKQCMDKIVNLINLKRHINDAYNSMKNTQNVLNYVIKENQTQNVIQKPYKLTKSFRQIHHIVSNFLTHYHQIDQQLKTLQQQYDQKQKQVKEVRQQQEQGQDQLQLDFMIKNLKDQIAQEKNLCLRYERQEKYLISKLYFTQNKNHDLKNSSSNLQIKNINLKDTIRLSNPKSSKQPYQQQKTMKRSLSMKLQRIKKYNLEENLINDSIPNTERKILRSKSTSSLNSPRLSSTHHLHRQKQTFLDKIY